MLARRREEVGDGFVFALEAQPRIAHDRRLREAADDAVERFLRAIVPGVERGAVRFR